MKQIKVIRIKSDNYNTYMSIPAYKEATLQMSTGDHATHQHKELMVTPDQLEDLKFESTLGFIDLAYLEDSECDDLYWFYFQDGTFYTEHINGEESHNESFDMSEFYN